MTAGNGSIMRLAPVALFFRRRPREAIARAADSSRTTPGAVDACRYLAAVLIGALAGAFYGDQRIPDAWRSRIAGRAMIESFATRLLELAEGDAA